MNIKPLGINVYFTPHTTNSVIDSGEKPMHGQVIAVGDKVTSVKTGDKIAFWEHAASTVEIEGGKFDFVQDDGKSIFCIYE